MTNAATYVYCLVQAPRRPVLRRAPRGLPATGPVRLLAVAPRLWLVVADAPLHEYGEQALAGKLSDLDWVARAAVAHAAVIERFVKYPAVLPLKLFTMFASDERAAADILERRRRIDRLLERVKQHDEWGVRLVLDPSGAGERPVTAARAPVSGSGYLASKKVARDRTVELARRGKETADDLLARLDAAASATRRRSTANGGPAALLLDAALLVPRSRARSFQSLVTRERRRLATIGYGVVLTGPWPAYSFMEE